jgi:hypothetical protein
MLPNFFYGQPPLFTSGPSAHPILPPFCQCESDLNKMLPQNATQHLDICSVPPSLNLHSTYVTPSHSAKDLSKYFGSTQSLGSFSDIGPAPMNQAPLQYGFSMEKT